MSNPVTEKIGFWIYNEERSGLSINRRKKYEIIKQSIDESCYWDVREKLFESVRIMIDANFWEPINSKIIN